MSIKEMIKYRKFWMGFAMLWIVFYHSKISCGGTLLWIKQIGYGGVDIFLFSSGIGNYYSYLKDCSPLDFMKRRIFRLAPSWVPFIIVWLAGNIFLKKISPFSIIGNLFGIQGLNSNGDGFNWYITGIIICYILTPYLATLVRKNSKKQNIIFILFLVVMSFAFWNDTSMIILATRLPIYYLGMTFAKNDDKQICNKNIIILFILFVFCVVQLYISFKFYNKLLWNYGLYWYPFILITPFLCILISKIIYFIERSKFIFKISSPLLKLLQIIGDCSFEIYLLHIFLFSFESFLIKKFQFGHQSIFSFGVAIFSIILAVCYNKLVNICKEKIIKRKNRNELFVGV